MSTVKENILFYKTNYILVIWLSLIFVVSFSMDQYSKHLMQSTMISWQDPDDSSLYTGKKQPVFILGDKEIGEDGKKHQFFELNFQYSRNKGAAFSFLANLKDSLRIPLFYLITVFAVLLIVQTLLSLPLSYYLSRYGLVMILSGALGNCADRITRGYVVDFISCNWNILGFSHNFAIFNVADVCINIGLGCLLIDMLLRKKYHTKFNVK